MDQMCREPDNDGLNFIQLLVIHDCKALLQVFIDNKYSIPNDIAAGALALANRYPNKQGTFELLKAYLSEQNKSLPTQGIDILDIAFKSAVLSSTNMDMVNMLNDDNHKNVSIKSSLEQIEAPQDILHSTIPLASGCEEPKLFKVPKKSDRRRKRNQVNKGLSTKGSLKKRQARVHTGEPPHQCGICGTVLSTKGNLKRHQVVHTK